jgi:hypothetical protein
MTTNDTYMSAALARDEARARFERARRHMWEAERQWEEACLRAQREFMKLQQQPR